ncbi:MAG: methyl-accepting chemotaxis protein, partial [Candidatus Caldatribacterium sp.]|nr:methyl-accepting chemotaxis protein [Candidatus Caldatribacterium sp.]
PLETRRTVLLEMFRRVLEGNESFLGVWACFEPNALDGRDAEFRGTEGHDDTGRFIPYLYREGGDIHLEPLHDYETPGAGDYYLLARESGREVLLEPYEYEVAGKKVLMTTCSVPVKKDGNVIGVVGVDIPLDFLQKQFGTVRVFQTGFVRLVSAKGTVVTHPQVDRVGKPWGEVKDSGASRVLERMAKGEVYTGVEYSEALKQYTLKSFVPFFVGQSASPWIASVVVPQNEVFARANKHFLRMLFFLVIGLVGVTLLMLFVSGVLSRPLQALALVAEEVARGNLRVEVPESHGRDEVARLRKVLRDMVANLKEIIARVVDAASQVAASSEELSSSIGEISRATQEIARTVAQVAEGSATQSQNLERINEEAQLVLQKVHALERVTSRNLSSVREMVSSVDENLRALQEIEAAMTVALQEGKETYGEAEKGRELLQVLSQNIYAIADVAKEVSQAIETLDQRSQEIGKIVEVITGIAEQTNLLALNAAIEAARAGEAGRGFAVVAEEVRKLAENSAQAAQQIAHLITQIRQDTRNAVERMERATRQVAEGVARGEQVTQSFARVIQAVETSISSLGNLASAFDRSRASQEVLKKRSSELEALSADSAREIQEVVRAVSSITERINAVAAVAEENAASSEEVSASTEEQSASLEELTSATESLAQLAENLRNLVERFVV